MIPQINLPLITYFISALIIITGLASTNAKAQGVTRAHSGNFGLPGIIDLPTARRLSDGELVITQQLHKSMARSGITFQALPRLGVSFRYTGHGVGGSEAYGRFNHDRSFDAHISVINEAQYLPEISIGLRDFIGTGWYSSEYVVGTKKVGNLELTAGLGFGRLSGRNSFSNPLAGLSSGFKNREKNELGKGGTLGTINWFHGSTSPFYGLSYQPVEKLIFSAEYTPDVMTKESQYLTIKSPWNFGATYKMNNYINLNAQYLHGSQASFTAQIAINPNRPSLPGGKELAPVPMRLRSQESLPVKESNEKLIRAVLAADQFEIHNLRIGENTADIAVTNTKFRSTAQAVGRVASPLQRFTSDDIKVATISFYSGNLLAASYRVNLEKIAEEQFNPKTSNIYSSSIAAIDLQIRPPKDNSQPKFTWGLGPYVTHRLFNPDLPLSMETGIEVQADYQMIPGLKLTSAFRKSVLTNLTDNKRRSNSSLPHVHSDWPLYDFAGQNGHIHSLKLSYKTNFAPGLYGSAHAGLLEPFFAGIGGEILYKPANSQLGFGIDLHRVRKRDYNMRLDLLDYYTTVGHFTIYYDAGEMFEIEVNAGRYLAGDWGLTTTISRKFGSGWEVGGYATLTDVPFDVFGEGSFDKAIYVSVPIDWIISSPNRSRRRLTLRPITRDGGANLFSARNLYKKIERLQNAEFNREFGRLWR